MELLAEHNRRVRQKQRKAPKYVPMKHSMKDVRAWEKKAGKKWYSLGPSERELANAEISKFIKERNGIVEKYDNHNSNTSTSNTRNNNMMKKNSKNNRSNNTTKKKRKFASSASNYNRNKSKVKTHGALSSTATSRNDGGISVTTNVSLKSKTRRKSDQNKKNVNTNNNINKTSSSIIMQKRNISKKNGGMQKTSMSKEEIDLLAAHNRKIRRKSGKRSTYEPLKHRMSDVKMWERKSGKRYYDLNPEEREQANLEITRLLKEKDNNNSHSKHSNEDNKNENENNINNTKNKRQRRPSLSDVYRKQIDPNIFNFHTPASLYKDIDTILNDNNFNSIHDKWFQQSHDEILRIPESLR